jgi:hypothetical protein
MMKSCMHLRWKKKSLKQILLLTAALKRMTPIAFKSQLGEIQSIMMATRLSAQRTWTQQNCTGTVWLAQKMQGTCALK